jgi:4-amino-4-deoxy-L-arabinose transferase-like glycosyltransferase
MNELAVLERFAASWRPWALLTILCAGLFLPGIAAMPPLDRDESRFMQATRQMLESHDYITIRFQDEARNKKPVGIYWLQAASVALLGDAESTAAWPYRLPSVLAATLAVLMTFAGGARLLGRPAALLGAALLASSLVLVSEAHQAKTDAVLLATVVAAQMALGALYRGEGRRRDALIFWLAQGIGILIKGPVTPLISLLTVIALGIVDRRWRWLAGLRPAWGVPLLLAITLPWLVAIEIVTGGAFASEAVGHDLIGKLTGAQESHGAPPGTYLLLAIVTMWPFSALLGTAVVAGWRKRGQRAQRFLIAWVVPTWIVFEIVPTKLPHYLLPVYPALALLAGGALVAAARSGAIERRRWLTWIVLVLWTAVALALAGGLVALPILWGGGVAWFSLVPALAILVLGFAILRRLWRGEALVVVPAIAGLALLVFVPSFAFLLPGLDMLWLSRSAASLVDRQTLPRPARIDAVGYGEPSLVFLLRGQLRSRTSVQAADDLAAADPKVGPGAWALVGSRDDADFRQALAARGVVPLALGSVSGINYSRSGAKLTLTLYARQGS